MSRGDDWKGVKVPKGNQIYASGLPDNITEKDFIDKFSQVGMIQKDPKRTRYDPGAKKVHLYKDKRSGKFKGDGTITFGDEDSAAAACEFYNNVEMPGWPGKVLKVSVSGFH